MTGADGLKLVLASHNAGKLRELRAILSGLNVQCLSPEEAGVAVEVEETGSTFLENAEQKCRAIYALVNKDRAERLAVLADDSGISADALNGAPGVYSARYGGLDSDVDRNALLLKNLAESGSANRAARFICAIFCLLPDGSALSAEGRCEGRVIEAPRGENGFGYDPLFVPDGFDKTLAELPSEIKNNISHRARALRLFEERLRRL